MSMVAFLALILAGAPVDSEQPLREVSVYEGHVTLGIPATWNEIPPEMLEFYSLRAAEKSGGRMTEIYQHGFRPDDPEIDFALPQILIQIRESGRLNYRQFLHMPSAEQLREAGERSLAEHVGPMVRGMELGNAVFDPASYSLHLTNTLDLSFEGETVVRSVAFLTERGLFTMHFYASASEDESIEPLFDRVVDSVRFDQEIAYHPRFSDLWPPDPPVMLIAAALLIAAIATCIHLLQRRQRPS